MNDITAYTVAFGLAALAMPLISYGTTNGIESLATASLVAIVVAGVIPLVVRYAGLFGTDSESVSTAD